MTADGHFQVPQPTNEPVRTYAPADPHRKSLKSRLAELTDARTEVPMQIGGERRFKSLARAVIELHCCVLGARSRSRHPIPARKCWQELVYPVP